MGNLHKSPIDILKQLAVWPKCELADWVNTFGWDYIHDKGGHLFSVFKVACVSGAFDCVEWATNHDTQWATNKQFRAWILPRLLVLVLQYHYVYKFDIAMLDVRLSLSLVVDLLALGFNLNKPLVGGYSTVSACIEETPWSKFLLRFLQQETGANQHLEASTVPGLSHHSDTGHVELELWWAPNAVGLL